MKTETVIDRLSEDLKITRETILEESLKAFLEKKLREIRSEVFEIRGKYGVSSVEDMEEKYKGGTLEEADSWQDFQKLDHLEYRKKYIENILREVE